MLIAAEHTAQLLCHLLLIHKCFYVVESVE